MVLLQTGALAQSGKDYRVGLVGVGASDNGILGPKMVENCTRRGYVVDRDIVFERRAAQGKLDRLPGFIDDLGMTLRYRAAEVEAPRLGMVIVPLGVRAPDDFDTAFSEMTKTPPDAILMVSDVLTTLNRKRVMQYAEENRLPAIYESASFAHDGGLMAYGPDLDAIFDRAAGLADRILKGAKPADLPLELPTRYLFAVNLKAAKAIGLTIPEAILLRADDLIE